jgi:autotransporter-associated beta strand protein
MKTLLAIPAVVAAFVIAVPCPNAAAGSATWNLNPTTGDWNTAANWTPATIPNGSSDTASFMASNASGVSLSANTEVSGLVFNPGAAAFTISPNPGTTLDITGTGVTNNSGVMQNFVATVDTNLNHGFIQFWNNTTAGSSTIYTNKAAAAFTYGGSTWFLGSSNAGSATFVNEGGAMPADFIVGGVLAFEDNSSAADAIVMNYGGTTEMANGGEVDFGAVSFQSTATAGNALIINYPATARAAQGGFVAIFQGTTGGDATFINNGATVSGAGGGVTTFSGGSAGNCTLIANAGSNGGRGGEIWFYANSVGGTSRVQVFGNGFLDTSNSNVVIGSIDGDVFVGRFFPLAVGTNNLDTVFYGRIRDNTFSGGGGSVKKVGHGTLVLRGASTHIGGITVAQGRLEVSNERGSGTGSGPVRVRGGKLGGRGIIAGPATVGTATGTQAVLSPGRNATGIGTLTIQSTLTFEASGVYFCGLNSYTAAADAVVANGVTIGVGSAIFFEDNGSAALNTGTVFTIINNTAATAIAGTFSDLADGGTFVAGSNTFQANYEGGDGNDLTLTVVP